MRIGGTLRSVALMGVFALIALTRPFLLFRDTVTGRVEGPNGKEVEGALVAALPTNVSPDSDPWQSLHWVHSDREGQFRMKLRRGTYAFSVTHPEMEGPGGVLYRTSSGKTGAPRLILRLGPGTSSLKGRLVPANGMHRPNGLVALAPTQDLKGDLNPKDGATYVAEVKNGHYRLCLPSGRYALATRTQGFGERESSVTLTGSVTCFDLLLMPAPSVPSREVIHWIREHAVGLVSCDPNQAQDDLVPLAAMVGSAKVVAVGEACHGTREFTQLTHRLIAFLVERMGFTAIGIEADPADTVALNAYILQGAGDPKQAVRELGFWTGPTHEVLNLARWLRQYNSNPAHPTKVNVFGIDPLLMASPGLEGRKVREKAMAERVQTILCRMPAESRVVVWVHNDHASKSLPEDWTGVESMGWHLREALGEDYLAVGTAFRRGAFLALHKNSHSNAIETFTVPAHREATLDAALAAVGKSTLVLDFRLIPAQGETATWSQTPQGTWRIGAEFSRSERQSHLCRMVAPRAFDLLIFVEQTRPPWLL